MRFIIIVCQIILSLPNFCCKSRHYWECSSKRSYNVNSNVWVQHVAVKGT